MPTLSKHYAKVTFSDGTEAEPVSVSITVDEAWAPYVQGTVVVPTNLISGNIDPTTGARLKVRLQQDLQNLLYVYEITEDYSGDVSTITAAFTPCLVAAFTRKYTATWNIFTVGSPISKVTTAYTPVTPLKLTNANLDTVWRMTDFLAITGTDSEAKTVFDGDLGIRTVTYDYVSKETTLELASDEAIAQDVYGFGNPSFEQPYYSIRGVINALLAEISTQLQPGTADINYPLGYYVPKYSDNVGQTIWDFILTAADAGKFKLYCDEQRRWYLVESTAVSGELELKDDDNITDFQKVIDRETLFYNQAIIEYEDPTGTKTIDKYTGSVVGGVKTFYQKKDNTYFPGAGAAQAIVERSITRGETYSVEAINNYNARPRQTLIVDITGEPVKTGIVQSITWALPSARMSVDIRNLEEV
jgi:hypothetical protein